MLGERETSYGGVTIYARGGEGGAAWGDGGTWDGRKIRSQEPGTTQHFATYISSLEPPHASAMGRTLLGPIRH